MEAPCEATHASLWAVCFRGRAGMDPRGMDPMMLQNEMMRERMYMEARPHLLAPFCLSSTASSAPLLLSLLLMFACAAALSLSLFFFPSLSFSSCAHGGAPGPPPGLLYFLPLPCLLSCVFLCSLPLLYVCAYVPLQCYAPPLCVPAYPAMLAISALKLKLELNL